MTGSIGEHCGRVSRGGVGWTLSAVSWGSLTFCRQGVLNGLVSPHTVSCEGEIENRPEAIKRIGGTSAASLMDCWCYLYEGFSGESVARPVPSGSRSSGGS